MLKNNIEIDVKVKCVEEQITQAELAEKTGTSPSYVNHLCQKRTVEKRMQHERAAEFVADFSE
ncbi:helix-turn-helix domain-containing protein [Bifidobacterium merycicum]|uniref:helix-turn-helix domain-containing protein n=1 Tax=Bifidobacterium merycicum TaxID=78345 RepID=UPI000D1C0085|nr:helix-turn-helix transcriptional regulator [Bifidobacterium merycicum]